uniref:Ixodegrin B n=1 Tax=Rhipicephalus appendiculatus TaxID=34631 RepID=A0A131YZ02_RHIAP
MESNSVNSLNAYAFLLMTFIATTTEGQHFPLLLPSVPRRFNQACNYTCQCDYGMCCLQRNGRQTCQLEASRGQPCTFLAFGGVYRNACPCASGEGRCHPQTKICTRTNRRFSPPRWPRKCPKKE